MINGFFYLQNHFQTVSWYMIFFLFIALLIASLWQIYTKAGKPGWASIIPIYNILVYLKVIGKPWWFMLLLLLPGPCFVIGIWMTNLMSKSFGKGVGFTLGLLFLPFIFYPILGFGKAEYVHPAGALYQQDVYLIFWFWNGGN